MTIPDQTTTDLSSNEICSNENINQHLKKIRDFGDLENKGLLPEHNTEEFEVLGQSLSNAFEALKACHGIAVPALTNLLESGNAQRVRHGAVITLGSMGETAYKATPELIDVLRHDPKWLHVHAARALGYLGVKAATTMIEALEEPEIRYELVYALGRTRANQDHPVADVQKLLQTLVEYESLEIEVRWMAAAGLAQQGVNMDDFFAKHQRLSPSEEEENKCSKEGEKTFFDIYEKRCLTIPIPRSVKPVRSDTPGIKAALARLMGKI